MQLTNFLFDRLKRSLLASGGLMLFAFGYYLQLAANIGLAPWTALNQGLANHLPITIGQASILISVVVIAADLLMGERIGLGTILDTLVVGWGLDLFVAWEPVPYQSSFLPGLGVLFAGLVAASLGQWLYMLAQLSCGPRDALMVALHKRTRRLSFGWVLIIISLIVTAAAMALGGQVGLGTVIALFGTGFVTDAVFYIVRFDPRTLTHEGLLETLSALKAALAAR